ncbi:MAG: GNAT family N-acetyltransferase [Planctomycetota bacterium]
MHLPRHPRWPLGSQMMPNETIQVRTARDIPAEAWDRYVKSHPKGSVFHTSAMLQTLAGVPKHHPIGLAALGTNGEIVALLAATRIETVSGLASRFASRCVWNAEPLCNADPVGHDGLSAIIDAHDDELRGRVLFTEVRPLLAETGERTIMESRDYVFKDYLNYVVDTTCSTDVSMARVGKSTRKKIRQSFKRGVEIVIDSSHAGIERMYGLVVESYRRSQIPLADIAMFHEAFDCLGESVVKIRLATHEGQDVAGGISLAFGDRFFAWYGGSTRPKGIVPFDCLTWDEIRWCTENQFRCYDFGGAGWPDEEYGPRDFKAKFGGELTHYGRYRKVYSPLKMRIAETGFKTLRRFVTPGATA